MKSWIIIYILFIISNLSATIINIPTDQPTIQEGINVSVNGDTVLVQLGTYIENINYNGKNITVASLFLTTEDPTIISQTIIDGNQDGTVVTFENGEDSTTLLYGFTITNGNAYYGGGIKCRDYSSPGLENLIITNNNSVYSGGGLYCKNNSSPELEDVIIKGNSTSFGGGIYCDNDSNLYIENVKIVNNSSNYGSGIYCGDSNPILKNLIITGNTASQGGGIYFSHSIPSLENTIIANNTSDYGGGIYSYYSNISLVNVTIMGHIVSAGGGIRGSGDSHPHFVNCILWNNSPEEISFNELGEPSSTFIEYSDIEGGESGIVTNYNAIIHWLEGNIDEDPLFVDAANGDYHLTENSPCIDAGDPNFPFDPDGTIVDMGAFYFDQSTLIEESDIQAVVYSISNYPNPFNPTTTIDFSIQNDSKIELSVFNIKGQKIKTLTHSEFTGGSHSLIWNGDDELGKSVSSGIYLYKLNVNGKIESVKKCLLLK